MEEISPAIYASLRVLRNLLDVVSLRLKQLSPEKVESKATPTTWSPKEELGHLIDSSANNHQRIVRAQLEDNLAMPGYDQNRWVALHAYQRRDWSELIDTWQALNRQLVMAAEAVPASTWSHTVTIAGSEPVTLNFVFQDYVAHMVHHLRHIGIELDPSASNAA